MGNGLCNIMWKQPPTLMKATRLHGDVPSPRKRPVPVGGVWTAGPAALPPGRPSGASRHPSFLFHLPPEFSGGHGLSPMPSEGGEGRCEEGVLPNPSFTPPSPTAILGGIGAPLKGVLPWLTYPMAGRDHQFHSPISFFFFVF